MHALLRTRELPVVERTVTSLLDRYDELVDFVVLDVKRILLWLSALRKE
jgi:hypothetical protein